MSKRTRVTLTSSQAESPSGRFLIDMILSMCHDGRLEIEEVEELHVFLRQDKSGFAAIEFLRAITRELVADGAVDDAEAYRLKLAFERVVPKEVRGVVSTHLQDIGLSGADDFGPEPAWAHHEATARQIEYIVALGGQVVPRMTKGYASKLIEQLLDRRPPTPRQVMLIRFFNRVDLMQSSKDEVSMWIDGLFASDENMERAWHRFKLATNHDPFETDPLVVPVGAFEDHLKPRPR